MAMISYCIKGKGESMSVENHPNIEHFCSLRKDQSLKEVRDNLAKSGYKVVSEHVDSSGWFFNTVDRSAFVDLFKKHIEKLKIKPPSMCRDPEYMRILIMGGDDDSNMVLLEAKWEGVLGDWAFKYTNIGIIFKK